MRGKKRGSVGKMREKAWVRSEEAKEGVVVGVRVWGERAKGTKG